MNREGGTYKFVTNLHYPYRPSGPLNKSYFLASDLTGNYFFAISSTRYNKKLQQNSDTAPIFEAYNFFLSPQYRAERL